MGKTTSRRNKKTVGRRTRKLRRNPRFPLYIGGGPPQYATPSELLNSFGVTLEQWLDASDPNADGTLPTDGSAINTWYDKSGNNRNMIKDTVNITASTGAPIFRANLIDSIPPLSMPAIDFKNPASPGRLISAPFATSGDLTFFIVCVTKPGYVYGTYWGHMPVNQWDGYFYVRNTNTGDTVYPTSPSTSQFMSRSALHQVVILSVTMRGGGILIARQYVLGKRGSVGFGPIGSTSAAYANKPSLPVIIGGCMSNGAMNQACGGYISECIYYKSVLTDNQIRTVEAYLAWKWEFQTKMGGSLDTSNIYYPDSAFLRPEAFITNDLGAYTVLTTLPGGNGNTNLAQWLDASDPNGDGTSLAEWTPMTRWADKSGKKRHMIKSSAGTIYYRKNYIDSTPEFNKPTIDFQQSGDGTFVSNSLLPLKTGYSLYFVGVHSDTTGTRYTFGGAYFSHAHTTTSDAAKGFVIWRGSGDSIQIRSGNGSSKQMEYQGGPAISIKNVPILYSCIIQESVIKVKTYIMGRSNTNRGPQGSVPGGFAENWSQCSGTQCYLLSGSDPNAQFGPTFIGSEAHGNIRSQVSEVIYFQEAHTDAQAQIIEGYLAWKWGFQTGNGGPLPTTHAYYSDSPLRQQAASAAIASGSVASAAIASAAIASSAIESAAFASGQQASAAIASSAFASGQITSAAIGIGNNPRAGAFILTTNSTNQTIITGLRYTTPVRYIRIRPALATGTGTIALSQIIIKTSVAATSPNVALNKPMYASSTFSGRSPYTLTDGILTTRPDDTTNKIWKNTGSKNDFIEIDLRSALSIYSIQILGTNVATDNNLLNVRIELKTGTDTSLLPHYEAQQAFLDTPIRYYHAIMNGEWIGEDLKVIKTVYNNSTDPAIIRARKNIIFVAYHPDPSDPTLSTTKLVANDDVGTCKFYEGTPEEYDPAKWDSYEEVPPGKYIVTMLGDPKGYDSPLIRDGASASIASAAYASGQMASSANASGQIASAAVASAAYAANQMASAAYASGQQYSGAYASGQNASGQQYSGAYASGQQYSGAYASGQQASAAIASAAYAYQQQNSAAYAADQIASAAYASGQIASGQQYSGAYASGQHASGQQYSGAYASGQQYSGAYASGQKASAAIASAAYAYQQQNSAAYAADQIASAAYAADQMASAAYASGQQYSGAYASGQQASAAIASAAYAKEQQISAAIASDKFASAAYAADQMASAAHASGQMASAANASAQQYSGAYASGQQYSGAYASGQQASAAYAADQMASAANASAQQYSGAYASGQQYSGAYASGQQYSGAYASGQQASAAYAREQQASAAYASGQMASAAYASGQQASAAYAADQMASAAYASGQMASAAYASGQMASAQKYSGAYASGQQYSGAYASGQQYSGAYASGQQASAAYAADQMASAAYASGQIASSAIASTAYAREQQASAAYASGQMASAAYASGQMASAANASAQQFSAAYASGQQASGQQASNALGIISLGEDPPEGKFLLRHSPLQSGGAAGITTTTEALNDITVLTNGYTGRYIRLKPSVGIADGYIHLSQIMVFDLIGRNVAAGKPVFASSSLNGTAPASILVDGSTVKRVSPNIWHSATANRNTEFVEIDLGSEFAIDSIRVIGRNDCPISYKNCQQRMLNIRIEISPDTTPDGKEFYDSLISTRAASAAKASAAYASGQIASAAIQVSAAKAYENIMSELQGSAARASAATASTAMALADQKLQASTAVASAAMALADQKLQASTAVASAAMASSANASSAMASTSIALINKGVNPSSGKFVFPLKIMDQIIPTNNLVGRYVRIRPATSEGDGIMNISQVMVFNVLGVNIAKGANVYATSTMPGSQGPNVIVDGSTTRRGILNIWESAIPDRATQFIEIDLGSSQRISAVRIIGRNDCSDPDPCTNRMLELRLEINPSTTQDVMEALALNASAAKASAAQASSAYASGQQASTAQASSAYASGQLASAAYTSDYQASAARAYTDIKLNEGHYILPTNDIDQEISTNLYKGRYIRIKPSKTDGDGFLNISQVIVSDPNGDNVALNKVVYATSIMKGGQKPRVVLDGETSYRNFPDMWQSNGSNRDVEFLEIDLGSMFVIDKIRIIGRANCNGSEYCENRMLNLRIEINMNTSPNIKEFYALQWASQKKTAGLQSIEPFAQRPKTAGLISPRAYTTPVDSNEENVPLESNPAEGKFVFSLNTKGSDVPQTGGGDTEIKSIDVNRKGRYVRILPSNSNGDGYINFSQIIVLNKDGKNIARGKATYSTSTMEGMAKSSTVVRGTRKLRSGSDVWQSATMNRDTEFIEIDLGSMQYISSVKIMGRNDCEANSQCSDRMAGIRLEINKDTSDDAKKEYATNKNGRNVRVTASTNTSTNIKLKG